MKIIKDYLGHEIHKGDIVLYSEKGSRAYKGTFTEGVVIEVAGTLRVLNYFTPERYKEEMEYHNRWGSWCDADGKFPSNVIDLTALGTRERVELDEQ